MSFKTGFFAHKRYFFFPFLYLKTDQRLFNNISFFLAVPQKKYFCPTFQLALSVDLSGCLSICLSVYICYSTFQSAVSVDLSVSIGPSVSIHLSQQCDPSNSTLKGGFASLLLSIYTRSTQY